MTTLPVSRARVDITMKLSETSSISGQASRPTPTLQAVRPGRAPDELVLVDSTGRCVLLRGDGLTLEESIWMCDRALHLLRGTTEPHTVSTA